MNARPSTSSISNIVQIFGWLRAEAARGFAAEALQALRIMRDIFRQKLQRHEAMQSQVFGFVNDPHTPTAELLQDEVVGNGLADHAQRCYGGAVGKSTKRKATLSSREGYGRKIGLWAKNHFTHWREEKRTLVRSPGFFLRHSIQSDFAKICKSHGV